MRNSDFTFSIGWAVVAVATAALLMPLESQAQQSVRDRLFGPHPKMASLPGNSNSLQKPEKPAVPVDNIYREAEPVHVPANVTFDDLLDHAIRVTSKRYLTAESADPHSPWQIFHNILAMRQETFLRVPNGKVNAIQWLSTTEPKFRGEPWMILTQHGAKFHPYSKTYFFEGHPAQFLALLSHSNLPVEHEFRVQGRVVKLADVIHNTMMEVNDKEEVTWILWALQHYLKSDAVWVNQNNETWSIERLVQIEAAHPVVGAACGGNHRLFALTKARDKYLRSGGTLRGVWMEADTKIRQHINLAKALQNSDGSFSGDSYANAKLESDVNKRFNTTGHTMEFLSVALPQERLQEQWVKNAVWMLSRELVIYHQKAIDCGPLFHTLNALILYRERTRPNYAASHLSTTMPSLTTVKPPVPSQPAAVEPAKPVAPKPMVDSTLTAPTQPAPAPALEKSAPKLEADAVPVPADSPSLELRSETTKAKPAPISIDTSAATTFVPPVKAASPKISADAMSNVGQPAPSPQPFVKKTGPSKLAKREPEIGSAPALLPDVEATPLNSFAEITQQLSEIAKPLVRHDEEPVSAMSPANQ